MSSSSAAGSPAFVSSFFLGLNSFANRGLCQSSSPLANSRNSQIDSQKSCSSSRAVMEPPKPAPSSLSEMKQAFNTESMVRPELLDMSPYTPILPYDVLASRLGRDPSTIVKLDANENPYGPSPSVNAVISSSPYLNIYPDPESTQLREAISEYTSLPKEYLLAGAGADELIDLLFRLFITPSDNDCIINCPPTFGMYKFDANVNVSQIHNIPRKEDFAVDIDAIERLFEDNVVQNKQLPKMIFVASPNNPDGSILSDDDLKRLLKLPTLVIIDEAYFEFNPQHNRLLWVPNYDNLVVLRTFSKWAGLAGLRIGYGAFPLNIIKHLWKIKQPYNVTVTSQLAGVTSIKEKDDLLGKVSKMIAQRDRFYDRVKHLDWLNPYPSYSNYVLCRVSNGREAADVKKKLEDEGILIRYYTSSGLADCIRISMGTDDQMERLYDVLQQL